MLPYLGTIHSTQDFDFVYIEFVKSQHHLKREFRIKELCTSSGIKGIQ